jgi:hypothetical protein
MYFVVDASYHTNPFDSLAFEQADKSAESIHPSSVNLHGDLFVTNIILGQHQGGRKRARMRLKDEGSRCGEELPFKQKNREGAND